jgi:hypothetical protein
MVRHFHWDEWQLYRFYNRNHIEYPNIPAPPNPEGLACFMFACLDETIKQLNRENSPEEAKKYENERERAAQQKWQEDYERYRR